MAPNIGIGFPVVFVSGPDEYAALVTKVHSRDFVNLIMFQGNGGSSVVHASVPCRDAEFPDRDKFCWYPVGDPDMAAYGLLRDQIVQAGKDQRAAFKDGAQPKRLDSTTPSAERGIAPARIEQIEHDIDVRDDAAEDTAEDKARTAAERAMDDDGGGLPV